MDLVTTKRKKPLLDLRTICQKDIRSEKTSSMELGRSNLKEPSRKLSNDLLEDIGKDNIDCIQ